MSIVRSVARGVDESVASDFSLIDERGRMLVYNGPTSICRSNLRDHFLHRNERVKVIL
jgi:hypothetical protein